MARGTAIYAQRPKAATAAPPTVSQNVPNLVLVDFHLFADLAPELQDTIWKFSCYANPLIVPMFIDDYFFKFDFNKLPAVPAVLHASSGSRAIALSHFTLLKAEVLNRPPHLPARPHQPQPLQPSTHTAQGSLPNTLQAPLLQSQYQNNGLNPLLWQNSNTLVNTHSQAGAANDALGQVTPYSPGMFAPFQSTLPAQASQPQGPNLQLLHSHRVQHFSLSQSSGTPQAHSGLQPGHLLLAPGYSNSAQLQQQQATTHQSPPAHGAFQISLQNHDFQQTKFGGSLQPTPGQSSGHQSFTQHSPPNHGALTHNTFGGSFQPAPIQSLGYQGLTQSSPQHHGASQQSIFGGSFLPTLSAAQQNFPLTISQLPGTNQTTAFQWLNPPTTSSNAPALQNQNAIQRPRGKTKRAWKNRLSRYFYVNLGSDFFRLQVGDPTSYHYPTFSLTQFPQLPNSVSDVDRLIYLQELQRTYTLPSLFPAAGRLPGFFAAIQQLVLTLELPPCHAPLRSPGFFSWIRGGVDRFCSIVVRSTVAEFPNIKNLDLLIAGDISRRENEQMVLRHWRCAPIREENGVTFGHAELGLLEMEIRIWLMSEFMGKNGPEGPEVRVVVHVPRHYSQTKW